MPVAGVPARALIPVAVAVILVIATAGLTAPGAEAAGGAIRVLEAREQVDFPNGVGLSVTAQSDADIVEVRVYFRASGSGTWGYAYADFAPGPLVIATQSIPVSESAYLAPGVDVEYYYQIKDAQGSVLKTERSQIEYLDDRYDWRRVNIGPLELIYHDVSNSRIADTARLLRQDLQRVAEILQLNPREGFKGVVYNNYRDANAVFPVQSKTTTDHGTFAGYAFPEQGVFVGQGLDRRIIVHESTHLLFREALGDGAVDVPAWLDEGFASYVEPNARIRSSDELAGRTPPLRGMNSVSGTPRTIPLFYHKSVSVVAHLIEDYGKENFRLLLQRLSDSESIEDALLNVYGFDVNGLEASWAGLPIPSYRASVPSPAPSDRESAPDRSSGEDSGHAVQVESSHASDNPLRTPVAPPPVPGAQEGSGGPSPFVFFDVWVLAGVAILVALILGSRFIYSRLRGKGREYEENGPEWDSPNTIN